MPILTTVRFTNVDGILRDEVQYDFAWDVDYSAGVITSIQAALQTWNTSVGALIGGSISRTVPPVLKAYDLSAPGAMTGGRHGSPGATINMSNLPAAGSSSNPNGLCLVLRLDGTGEATAAVEGVSGPIPTPSRAVHEGAPATHTGITRPQSRHRGRIYFGPLGTAVTTTGAGTNCVPAASSITTINAACSALRTALPSWSVWSRRDGAMYRIQGGSIANTFGYQRLRQQLPTTRTAWA